MILGIIGILGSAADLGIIIPLVVVVAIGVGYALIRFNRSLDAALAAAPSRQPGASGSDDAPEPGPETSAADGDPERSTARRDCGRGRSAEAAQRSDPDQPPLTLAGSRAASAPRRVALRVGSGPPRCRC